jgi:transcription-repair coupling factor (superfamily II helicase)
LTRCVRCCRRKRCGCVPTSCSRAEALAARAAENRALADKAANTNLAFRTLPDLAVQAQQKSPLDNLRKFLESFTGPVVFSVESEGRREALASCWAH